MRPVEEFHRVTDSLCVWQGFNPSAKVDCTSTAVLTDNGWVVIDPIALEYEAMDAMLDREGCAGILLSSGNHQRDSLNWKKKLGAKIFAPVTTEGELTADVWFETGSSPFGLKSIPLPGAALGETAFLNDKTVIVGDALIHLGELTILPDKYCEDADLLRESLEKLAAKEFANLCFAHGMPLMGSARPRMAALL